jgi:hypothetical protein
MASPELYTIIVKTENLPFNPYSLFDDIYGNKTSNFDGYIKSIDKIKEGFEIKCYFVEDREKRIGLMKKYPDTWKEEHEKLVEKAVREKLGDSNIDVIVRQLENQIIDGLDIMYTENTFLEFTSRERWPGFPGF